MTETSNIGQTQFQSRIFKNTSALNNNFLHNKKLTQNTFNKNANNLSNILIKNRDEENKSGSTLQKNSNTNTINYINNNNINLTHLNVNLNLNLNNHTNHSNSRNLHLDRNMDLLDKITILKRSVDKYSEEAKKKFEFQLLRNTINNDPLMYITGNNASASNTIFKKVDPIRYNKNLNR